MDQFSKRRETQEVIGCFESAPMGGEEYHFF